MGPLVDGEGDSEKADVAAGTSSAAILQLHNWVACS